MLVAAALALAAVVARPVLPLDGVARPAAPTVGEVERTAIPVVALLAAVHAYLNDGPVVSWTVVLGPVAGLQVASAVTPAYPTLGPPGLLFVLVYQSWFVLSVTGVIGTAGFLWGVGTRELQAGVERVVGPVAMDPG